MAFETVSELFENPAAVLLSILILVIIMILIMKGGDIIATLSGRL